jgi:hypothetical protein
VGIIKDGQKDGKKKRCPWTGSKYYYVVINDVLRKTCANVLQECRLQGSPTWIRWKMEENHNKCEFDRLIKEMTWHGHYTTQVNSIIWSKTLNKIPLDSAIICPL